MKKLLLAACLAAMPLAGCETVSTTAPAPLQQTVIDERALLVAINGAEAIRTAVDALVAANVIQPGTMRALQTRDLLINIRDGLNGAAAAQKAGSSSSYVSALAQANEAITKIRAVLKLN